MNAIAVLKQRVLESNAERDLFRSMVEAFFSGNVPANASPEHLILARWGRRRHEEMKSTAALLRTE
jgi:hypothetical protein